jgi:hypothetical protein
LREIAPVEGIAHSGAIPNFQLRVDWLLQNADGELPDPLDILKELGVV